MACKDNPTKQELTLAKQAYQDAVSFITSNQSRTKNFNLKTATAIIRELTERFDKKIISYQSKFDNLFKDLRVDGNKRILELGYKYIGEYKESPTIEHIYEVVTEVFGINERMFILVSEDKLPYKCDPEKYPDPFKNPDLKLLMINTKQVPTFYLPFIDAFEFTVDNKSSLGNKATLQNFVNLDKDNGAKYIDCNDKIVTLTEDSPIISQHGVVCIRDHETHLKDAFSSEYWGLEDRDYKLEDSNGGLFGRMFKGSLNKWNSYIYLKETIANANLLVLIITVEYYHGSSQSVGLKIQNELFEIKPSCPQRIEVKIKPGEEVKIATTDKKRHITFICHFAQFYTYTGGAPQLVVNKSKINNRQIILPAEWLRATQPFFIVFDYKRTYVRL